ncbi:MAG: WYL domain-containing protein [Candidatus Contendobacter sp.]|nr:WYL domain-containing protein [Candidatus Contendobacter sp.]MDG4559341.1 WYL domain-containing protein [Candidatus Contendobacter sp.]
MKEDAITTFNRRLRILAMFKGSEPLTTQMIFKRLQGAAEEMDERSVQRVLVLLGEGGFLETVNPNAKPLQWRWRKGQQFMTLPRMADQEALAFRLLELFLKPLLPRESYRALRPYFETARGELNDMPFWAPVRNWETKVRVVPPAQPLLPPEPPPELTGSTARQDWERQQERTRAALLEALFENRQCAVEYQQIWRDKPARWTLHPLVYLQRGPAFYLLCTIEDYADVRQLAVHRMLSARVLDQKASKPAGFNVDQEVERCQGMGGSGEPLRLVVRFWRPAGSHLLETRLAADQIVDDEDDDHFRLTATVNDTAQLRWWLLSFGSKAEVLEPASLREEMANQAYWMNRMYARPNPLPDNATDTSRS